MSIYIYPNKFSIFNFSFFKEKKSQISLIVFENNYVLLGGSHRTHILNR